MQSEVYAATNTSTYTSVSTTAKNALSAPQTKETIASAKAELTALVAAGKVKFKDNLHTLLNTPNPQTVFTPSGAAQPTVYHNLDSLNLQAIKLS
jgi:uncharacterized surface protein with fasciclin (FAS1) repeats